MRQKKRVTKSGYKFCPCPDHEGEREIPIEKFGKTATGYGGTQGWCKICLARKMRLLRRTRRHIRLGVQEDERRSRTRHSKKMEYRVLHLTPTRRTIRNHNIVNS